MLAVGVMLLMAGAVCAAPVIISSGYVFPFSISEAPSTFGSYGGSFFITDTTTGNIMIMPPGGGAPTVFQHGDGLIRGGLFLPPSFGTSGGQYALLSVIPNPADPTSNVGRVTTYAASGNASVLSTGPVNPTTLFDPAIAPSNFGAYGGQLFITSQFGNGSILRVDQAGNINPFVILPEINVPGVDHPITVGPTGLTFAPAGFGSIGGMMLTNSFDPGTNTMYIEAIDALGNVSLFASVPLQPGEFGPRQMAFAPSDFGAYSGMLFLSIASSNDNTGLLGAVDAIDAFGNDVATLVKGSDMLKFNPRGLLFQPGGELLISDASDPIYLARPSDFRSTQVPEPASVWLMLIGMSALVGQARQRRRRGSSGAIGPALVP